VALALADAGSRVVLGARSVAQLDEVATAIAERGGQARAIPLDVADLNSVEQFFYAAAASFQRLDVLVNNAGSNNGGDNGAIGPLWEINPEAWWYDIEVNLRGTFLCTRAVLPHMISAGGGHIVNVVSTVAAMAWPYNTAYACSKAGVIRLTDSVAEEVRENGVYLFALSPGSVDTELRAGAVESAAGRRWLTKVNPNPRWVAAEAPAAAVVLLASGEADGLTGRFLSVDWDLAGLAQQAGDIAARDVLQLRLLAE
jgi:NAD(P)-dependent dehydrogenase (short-subunit alcohol dehydrogenase family)